MKTCERSLASFSQTRRPDLSGDNFIYQREGDLFVPSPWAGSPWSPTAQHGGPVNALLMHGAEAAAESLGMQIARLTVDLFQPVPLEPLQLGSTFLRRGRRLAIVELNLRRPGDETSLCSARAVLLAPRDELAPMFRNNAAPLPGPEGLDPISIMPEDYRRKVPPGFHWSLELRMTGDSRGPIAWITTPLDLIEGEPMTSHERCAAVADLTFAVASHLRPTDETARARTSMMLINTDTTLHFERPPEGAWFAHAEGFLTDQRGVGLSEVTIHDCAGRVGRAAQTLVANGAP